jgi:hypothetical protein
MADNSKHFLNKERRPMVTGVNESSSVSLKQSACKKSHRGGHLARVKVTGLKAGE